MMIEEVLERLRQRRPLVHVITNYVTIRDCANILLACGASPVMADAPQEAAAVTARCDGLVVNLGMLNEQKREAIRLSCAAAAAQGKPVVLDPVGAGSSEYRLGLALELLERGWISAVRGNAAELHALEDGDASSRGVDAEGTDGGLDAAERLQAFCRRYGVVAVQTGAVDLAASGKTVYRIYNGHPMMRRITGSGCMLSAVTGACCAAWPDQLLEACAGAACLMGVAGERAFARTEREQGGTGSFGVFLTDAVSRMEQDGWKGEMRFEIQC